MAAIFISYSRDTRDTVRALAEDFAALGDTAWFDQEIAGGQSWWNRILEQVRVCDVFVAVLHPTALESTACKRECAYAAALGKTILPVLISNDVSTNLLPPGLVEVQYVDYRVQDRGAALALARALKALPPSKALPVPLPAAPDAPLSYLGGIAQKADKPVLTQEEQNLLVVDLREALDDPQTAGDARTLLRKLKERRDLYARVERQIDELLADARRAAQPRANSDAPSAAASVAGPTQAMPLPPARAPAVRDVWRTMGRLMLLVQIAGFLAAGLAVISVGDDESEGYFMLFVAGAAAATLASLGLLGMGIKRRTRAVWQGGIGLVVEAVVIISIFALSAIGESSVASGILILVATAVVTACSVWTRRTPA